MSRISINGSTSYDVVIERNIMESCGELLRDEIGGDKALIVTDSNVGAIFLNTVSDSLREAGYEISSISLAPGDQSKTLENYAFLLGILSDKDFAGTDILVALGGGMIGDLVGFVASTYHRGMKCIQIPTSLLAAVDSSVGGKTAVNLPAGKNQVGTIHNPSIVLCDPNAMSTLSSAALHEGYAEIIKYGILKGHTIINDLELAVNDGDYTDVIEQAVTIKRDIVEMDEEDKNFRQYLNLGHLIGHAIEASSDYSISHGQAVAEGLVLEARCAALSGYTEMSVYIEICDILEKFDFDISNTYSFDELGQYLMHDKRLRNGSIQLIIPESIGSCSMRLLNSTRLQDYISKGL